MPNNGPSLKDLFDQLSQQNAPGNMPRPGSSFFDRLATWGKRALIVAVIVLVVIVQVIQSVCDLAARRVDHRTQN